MILKFTVILKIYSIIFYTDHKKQRSIYVKEKLFECISHKLDKSFGILLSISPVYFYAKM